LTPDGFYLSPGGTLVTGQQLTRALDNLFECDVRDWPRYRGEDWCPFCEHCPGALCRQSPARTLAACDGYGPRRVPAGREPWGVVWDVGGHVPEMRVYPLISRVEFVNRDGKPLLAKHYHELLRSGLSRDTIDAAGIYSEARPEVIRSLLGWDDMWQSIGPVMVFPYRDRDGTPVDYCRVKPSNPRTDEDEEEKPIKYEAPKGRPNRPYFPPRTLAAIADPGARLLITEGEKKALKADQEGFPCVGLSGVWSWQQRRPRDANERPLGPRQLLPELDAIRWLGRPVYICFDSDAAVNDNVRAAERSLAYQLAYRGAAVKFIRLPEGEPDADGEPAKVGLDDYLLSHSANELESLMTNPYNHESISLAGVDNPHRLAELFLENLNGTSPAAELRYWHGQWYKWDGTTYREHPDYDLESEVTAAIHEHFVRHQQLEVARWQQQVEAQASPASGTDGGAANPARLGRAPGRPKLRNVTKAVVQNTIQALESICLIRSEIQQPAWHPEDRPIDPKKILNVRNGLLILDGGEGSPRLISHTPAFFSTSRPVGYDYDPAAAPPAQWLHFLRQLWAGDAASIECLQEWIGYILSGETAQQKMLLIVGPPRAGKGTIGKVLSGLIGEENVASPTFSSLAEQFGLQSLLHKSLALINDARLPRRQDGNVVIERLLQISGEDTVQINRKFAPHLQTKLGTRIVIMTNEMPVFEDASGALASRFIVLQLTKSWLGKEDPTLADRLLAERAGILLWALEGLRRLKERGRFVQPPSAVDAVDQMTEHSSPIKAFLHSRCILRADLSVPKSELIEEHRRWCTEKGYTEQVTPKRFGLDLKAAAPQIKSRQKRRNKKQVEFYEGVGLKPSE
jgi:putative DNA primase/helicase